MSVVGGIEEEAAASQITNGNIRKINGIYLRKIIGIMLHKHSNPKII